MICGFACAGGAMALFEELELWDNLIACHRLLQKKPQACGGIDAQASIACSSAVPYFPRRHASSKGCEKRHEYGLTRLCQDSPMWSGICNHP